MIASVPQLQTAEVDSVLRSCANDAEELKDILRGLLDEKDKSRMKKWANAFGGILVEKKVIGLLQSLEVGKTSLALCVAQIDSTLLCGIDTRLETIQGGLTEVSQHVMDELPLIRSAMEKLTGRIAGPSLEERTDACLTSLTGSDQASVLSQALRRSKQAGAWLMEKSDYVFWQDCPESSLILITANPGFGKTTLAAHICHHIKTKADAERRTENTGPQSILLYFFFQRTGHEKDGTAAVALGSMVTQTIQQLPNLFPVVLRRYDSLSARGNFEWSWEHLHGLMEGLLDRITQHTKVHIILDAIDECEIESRGLILDWIESLICEGGSGASVLTSERPAVKVMITTRPDDKVSDQLSCFTSLDITEWDTKLDMQAMIRHLMDRFSASRNLDPGVSRKIITFLEENAHGMFLWVHLIMEELKSRDGRLSDETISTRLSWVPITLANTYHSIIQRPPTSRRKDMWRIIRWLLYGRRGLTLAELETALCLETKTLHWYDLSGDLKFLCGSLIRFEGTRGEINFIHQTARNFLERVVLKTNGPEVQYTLYMPMPMDITGANQHLAEVCVQYLSRDEIFVELESLVFTQASNDKLRYQYLVGDFLKQYPFLCYAIENWSYHLHAIGQPPRSLFNMTMLFLSSVVRRDGIMRLTYYILLHGNPVSPVCTPEIHLASYFNLPWLVAHYMSLSNDPIVNLRADAKDTPLIWAAEMGSTACAKLLLESGADPNLVEWDGWSPLHWAARNGHLEGLAPVHWAAGGGYWDIFDVLDKRAVEEQRLKLEKIMQEKYSMKGLVVVRSIEDRIEQELLPTQ